MQREANSANVLRGAAIYDLVVTGPLVLAPLVPLVLQIIGAIDRALGFGTVFTPLDPTAVFFVNLAAASVLAWAAIRLVRPDRSALLIDIAYRVVLIACQIWAVADGATPVLLGISAVLALIAVLEAKAWRRGMGHRWQAESGT